MFVISSSNPMGARSASRLTAVEAIECAVEMMGQGFSNVTITAPDGQVYHHTEFQALLPLEGDNASRS